ncbi:MAG: hypothetical protein KGZ50_03125 [Peptococcaceae bacterium]|jgi:hypothetical protein|nr:hypothetical protein [Peptococcaceae bacterium]
MNQSTFPDANPSTPQDSSMAATDHSQKVAESVPIDVVHLPDALAGALPNWDLLPTSAFIRRVK